MFKTMTSVLKPGNPTPEEIQKIPSFIFCRWLSGNPSMIHMANVFNQYYDIPIENQFYAVKHQFQGKVKFVPYPKNIKSNQIRDAEIVSEVLNLSYEKSVDYLKYVSATELSSIKKAYEIKRSRK